MLANCGGSVTAEVDKYYFQTTTYVRKLSQANDQFVSAFWFKKIN